MQLKPLKMHQTKKNILWDNEKSIINHCPSFVYKHDQITSVTYFEIQKRFMALTIYGYDLVCNSPLINKHIWTLINTIKIYDSYLILS